jgi:hypothetical protein
MIKFILIIFVHVGPLGTGNSNSLTNVPGFISQEECEAAGKAAKKRFTTGVKNADYICVAQRQQ